MSEWAQAESYCQQDGADSADGVPDAAYCPIRRCGEWLDAGQGEVVQLHDSGCEDVTRPADECSPHCQLWFRVCQGHGFTEQ